MPFCWRGGGAFTPGEGGPPGFEEWWLEEGEPGCELEGGELPLPGPLGGGVDLGRGFGDGDFFFGGGGCEVVLVGVVVVVVVVVVFVVFVLVCGQVSVMFTTPKGSLSVDGETPGARWK
jgi:hypothetical protein